MAILSIHDVILLIFGFFLFGQFVLLLNLARRTGAAWEDWQGWSAIERQHLLGEFEERAKAHCAIIDGRLDEANQCYQNANGLIGRVRREIRETGMREAVSEPHPSPPPAPAQDPSSALFPPPPPLNATPLVPPPVRNGW